MSDKLGVLVIMDGGLGSMVACASARSAPNSSAPLWGWGTAAVRHEISEILAQFGGDWIANKESTGEVGEPTAHLSLNLLSASLLAAEQGISRVIWPVHAGVDGKPHEMDLDAASSHVDRALLVTRLTSVDARAHKCVSTCLETPYADFSDRQLAELALDMGVPFRKAAWWGDGSSAHFARWRRVFDAIGSLATS